MTGFNDYLRMYKARGFGRVWHHFKDITLYDLIHNVDTDTWLPISKYESAPENIEFAIQYQPSFTSEINKSLKFVANVLGKNLKEFDFYDLGSGKGKVCFLARKYPFREIHGIEFYQPLFEIAQKNKEKFSDPRIAFHCEDVTQHRFASGQLVFFAYNPFHLEIWTQLLNNIADKKWVVIYNNPVHTELFKDKYVWFDDRSSEWENKRTVIFSNFKPD